MSTQYYTKQQVDELATIIGIRIKNHSASGQSPATLESSKFLGTFLASDEIPLDKAVAGSYADVDAGPGETVSRWIYDADNGAFVKATGEVAGETSVSVKEKYESNPNTNAFTDNHKTILEALQGLAPATTIESFLEAFNAAMLGITPEQL